MTTCTPARLAAEIRITPMPPGPRPGRTAPGVALPDEDPAEVGRRFGEFRDELRPTGGVGRFLARRAALLSVRLDRCARHEAAALGSRMRHAGDEFDRQRLAEVDHLMSYIAREPATHVRQLRSMPEGVDRMIAAFLELREELDERGASRWDLSCGMKLADLTGSRYLDAPTSAVRALSEAVQGQFGHLDEGQGEGLDEVDRRIWARDRLVERIDAEVEALRAHRATLDLAAIEEDRAGAAARALFDPSPGAILARKYEAAAERGLFRTLRELRQVEAEAAARPEVPPPIEAPPEEQEELGSCWPEADRPEPRAPIRPAPRDFGRPRGPAGRPDGRPGPFGGPGGGPA